MTKSHIDFEERLRRIEERRASGAGRPIELPAAGLVMHSAADTPKRRSLIWPLLTAAVTMTVGLVLLLMVFLGPATVAEMVRHEVSRNLEGADGGERPLVNRIVAMVPLGLAAAGPEKPVDFLPGAPEGWLRVTEDDAASPGLLEALGATWPPAPDQPSRALDQNPGHDQLMRFVALRTTPDIEQRVLSKTRTTSIYLGQSGEFLVLRLVFADEVAALGAEGDPEGWIEALAARERAELDFGEELLRSELDGMAVLNRVDRNNPLSRPVTAETAGPIPVKIAAALGRRAFVQVHGVAAPSAVAAILAGFDRAALEQRLD